MTFLSLLFEISSSTGETSFAPSERYVSRKNIPYISGNSIISHKTVFAIREQLKAFHKGLKPSYVGNTPSELKTVFPEYQCASQGYFEHIKIIKSILSLITISHTCL